MARVERVAGVFILFRESRNTPEGSESGEIVFPAAQDLVGVGLMSHVPDDLVLRRRKRKIHGHGELHHAKIAGQVTAGLTGGLHQETPDLLRQGTPLPRRDLLQISGAGNTVKYHIHL